MNLDDGEIIVDEEGVHQRCPKCNKLTPKVINGQSLLDLRCCVQGFFNVETGLSEEIVTCDVCGQAL